MDEPKFGKYVVRQYESKNIERFAIDCACSDNEHRLLVDMECNKEDGDVALTFYMDLFLYDKNGYPYEYYGDCKNPIEVIDLFYNRMVYYVETMWARIKRATAILFTGHSKFQGDFYMYDLDHIDEFIEALTYARNRMDIGQKNMDSKRLEEYNKSKIEVADEKF